MAFSTIVQKWRSKKKPIKLLILYAVELGPPGLRWLFCNLDLSWLKALGFKRGLDNSGKSTAQAWFSGERIESISPTAGFKIRTVRVLE